jgi:hypothetical protein
LHVFKTASGFAQEIDLEIAFRNTEVLALENDHVPVFSVLAPALDGSGIRRFYI